MPILTRSRMLRIVPLVAVLYDEKEEFVDDLRRVYRFYYRDEEETIDNIVEVVDRLFDLFKAETKTEMVLIKKGDAFEEIRTDRDLMSILNKTLLSTIFSEKPFKVKGSRIPTGEEVFYFDEKRMQELIAFIVDVFMREVGEEEEDVDPVEVFDTTYEFLADGIIEFIKRHPTIEPFSIVWKQIGVVWKYKGRYMYARDILTMFKRLKEKIYLEVVSKVL